MKKFFASIVAVALIGSASFAQTATKQESMSAKTTTSTKKMETKAGTKATTASKKTTTATKSTEVKAQTK